MIEIMAAPLLSWRAGSRGRERATVLEPAEEEWDRVMARNVRGPLTASRYAARAMIEARHTGAIVNVSSMAGTPHGIRVNAECPGVVAASRVKLAEKAAARPRGSFDVYRRRWLERRAATIPLRRVATAEDVAEVAGFLASDRTRYMIGQCLSVDAAWSCSDGRNPGVVQSLPPKSGRRFSTNARRASSGTSDRLSSNVKPCSNR
jgi:NAD(P)-dependent dehydrogenase (short-subunit alcohol dehydrogenase family)